MKLPGVFELSSVGEDGSVTFKSDEGATVVMKPLPEEQITGDEMAARLFAEQGYLAIASNMQVPIGFIIRPEQCIDTVPHSTPLRVVSESSREEFEAQRRLSERLWPGSTTPRNGDYFYRTEAAD